MSPSFDDWEQEQPDSTAQRLAAIMEYQIIVNDVQAMVVARRESLEADGFSPTVAERMAWELWTAILGRPS